MEKPRKKANRGETLKRCEAVAETVSGSQTPLDAAFAAFDDKVGDDPATLHALQEHVRQLLSRGMK